MDAVARVTTTALTVEGYNIRQLGMGGTYPAVTTNQSPWTLNKMRRPDVNRAPTADTDKRYHLGTDGTANDDKRDHLIHGAQRAIATTKPTASTLVDTLQKKSIINRPKTNK
uniref:Uncharacterized protein n=1 Tax=Pseudo-nitzschia australis TaxID=44445 RepID=A0A7S4APV3_9STRA